MRGQQFIMLFLAGLYKIAEGLITIKLLSGYGIIANHLHKQRAKQKKEKFMSIRDLVHINKSKMPANSFLALQDNINSLFRDMMNSNWLNRNFNQVSPAVDIVENGKEFRVTAELPGMDSKDIKINIADNYITLHGEKSEDKKEEKEGYYRHERSYGSFQRTITLPDSANLDKAEANFSKGLLTINVPKKAASQTKERQLDIKNAA